MSKTADLKQFIQGGQLYLAFPFSKGSLASFSLESYYIYSYYY
jgi:hypothetical protein